MREATGVKTYTCGTCDAEFNSREEREAHLDANFGHGVRRNLANRPKAGAPAANQYGTFTVSFATEKQTKFIASLLDRKDVSSLENADTLRQQVKDNQVNKNAASGIIDTLLALPDAAPTSAKGLGNTASEKQFNFLRTLFQERQGNETAENLRAALNIIREQGKVTPAVASETIEALLAIPANGKPVAAEHKKGDIHVVDGQYVRIHIAQSTGNPYACVANILRPAVWAEDGTLVEAGEVEWEFVSGLVRKCTVENKATAEQAKQFSRLAGRCCFCSHAIDTPESTLVGYGPVCAKKYDLPWGSTAEAIG